VPHLSRSNLRPNEYARDTNMIGRIGDKFRATKRRNFDMCDQHDTVRCGAADHPATQWGRTSRDLSVAVESEEFAGKFAPNQNQTPEEYRPIPNNKYFAAALRYFDFNRALGQPRQDRCVTNLV
jgi:hypothetical protein